MTSHYNETNGITYYENTFVVEFRQKEKGTNVVDMRVFILYDSDEELMYVYGSRKSENSKYPNFVKTFADEDQMYDFLDIMLDFARHKTDTAVHQIVCLMSDSDFDDIAENVTNRTELSGFDNVKMTKKNFRKYLNVVF